jgi:hypothetical protein
MPFAVSNQQYRHNFYQSINRPLFATKYFQLINLQLSNVARFLHSTIPPRLSINQSILVAAKPNQLINI